MENFIVGYPSTESAFRSALARELGARRSEVLLASLLEAFFGDKDAAFLAAIGVNSVRIPLNYRHFEDDLAPRELKPDGFAHLDRALTACRRHGLYAVLDLHSLPGAQNHHWHSDNRVHRPLLWEHRDFQDRAVGIWVALATRYKDEPWVAGYNLVNEPADEQRHRLGAFYRRLATEIRSVDPRHVLFLDGNRYARDFECFGEPLPNAVYAVHQYPAPGALPGEGYPGVTAGRYYDANAVAAEFDQMTAFMRANGVPTWVGELGPVYTADAKTNAGRRQLLADQLRLYNERGVSWSLWTYKDIGVQGLLRVGEGTPWMRRTVEARRKKQRLGADSWAGDTSQMEDVMGPLLTRLQNEFPRWDPYPFGPSSQANLLVRHMLFAEPLTEEFAKAFSGASEEELVELGRSFEFSSCRIDEALADVLHEACTQQGPALAN